MAWHRRWALASGIVTATGRMHDGSIAHRRVVEVLLEEHLRDHALQCRVVCDLLHERLLHRRIVDVQLQRIAAITISCSPVRDSTPLGKPGS